MKRKYPVQPIAGVGAVIVNSRKILLVKRSFEPGKGKWTIPGGLVELGETPEETVIREVMEECGLEVENPALIDVVNNVMLDKKRKIKYHFIILDFLVELKGGRLVPNEEILEAKWVPLEDVEKYNLTSSFREFFQRNRDLLEKIDSYFFDEK
jgi:mutator protein MutT